MPWKFVLRCYEVLQTTTYIHIYLYIYMCECFSRKVYIYIYADVLFRKTPYI